jgi:hypothetical protein
MSTVFLCNLPKKGEIVMKLMLNEYFSKFGKIVNISIPNTESGKCKRHAFVYFEKKSTAAIVLKTREHSVKIYTIVVDKADNAPDLWVLPPMPVAAPAPIPGSIPAPIPGSIPSVKIQDIEDVNDTNPFPAMEISYSIETEKWAIKEGCTMAMTEIIDDTLAAIKDKDEYSTMLRVEDAMDKIFKVIRFAEDNLDYSKYHRKVFEECCRRILGDEDTATCLESVKSALIV